MVMFSNREKIVLGLLISILVAINLFNYFRMQNLNRGLELLIIEGTKKLSINEAEAQELESLPGIGPALAERIVSYRSKYGKFQSLDDLKKVKGIGDRLLSRISPFLEF